MLYLSWKYGIIIPTVKDIVLSWKYILYAFFKRPKNKTAEMIKAINKLADKYPTNVANVNQKIWRSWE